MSMFQFQYKSIVIRLPNSSFGFVDLPWLVVGEEDVEKLNDFHLVLNNNICASVIAFK